MWGLGSLIPPILFQFPAFPSSPLDSSGGPWGWVKLGFSSGSQLPLALCCSLSADPRSPGQLLEWVSLVSLLWPMGTSDRALAVWRDLD